MRFKLIIAAGLQLKTVTMSGNNVRKNKIMTMTCLATKEPKSSQGGTNGLINPHSNTKQTGGVKGESRERRRKPRKREPSMTKSLKAKKTYR